MADNDPTEELLLRWEEARRQGCDLPPEKLCADCPDRTEEIRRRIISILAMEKLLGVTDHDPNATMLSANGAAATSTPDEILPTIPGYDILRIIDHGGMGVVYEARQRELGRTVAVKMISGAKLRPKSIDRFRAEAEAAARLHHPNIVHIIQYGDVNGRPYYSMEYVSGGSVGDRIARQPLTPHASAELVETLARAAQVAHERGIVHRDLKPSNIMLAADGTPKIADFGLAKRLDDDSNHTHTGEVLGTPGYMAPEQAEGKKDEIGPRTDVYALGAILYELLAGRPPFQGSSPLDSLRLVMTQDPTPPTRIVPTVPRDLEAICLKCLEKSASHRYESALALADDLRRFLDGKPVIARHIGPLQRGWKWVRRHPQTVLVVIACASIIFVPLLFVLAEARRQHQLDRKADEEKARIVAKAKEQAPLVQEILQRNCYECHGADAWNIQKDLNILNHAQLLDSARRIVVPGEPERSRLIQRIEDGSMPPEEEEQRLPRVSETELSILRDWIRGGAPALPEPDPAHPVQSIAPYSDLAAQTKEIFRQHCYECHKSDVAKGGIKILHHRLLVTVRGVVVPGDAKSSELYGLLQADEKNRMPPATYGPPLSTEDIATVRRWIEAGAPPFPKSR
ncbi:MAG TPA: protein kinase [Gemmataceae bacterium]|nr:protein kinase [Gemmataceae bacterium]